MKPDSLPSTPRPPLARAERIAVLLVLGLFLAVGLNNVSHRAFIGQDFTFHLRATNHLLNHPDQWFVQDNTSRPLIYWIALAGLRVTQNRAPFEFAAVVCLVLNAGALALLHALLRRLVDSAALRVAALAFVAFLPVTLITSVVFAADALAPPCFLLLAWSVVRWTEAADARSAWRSALLGGAALTVGLFAKFTFTLLPAAALVVLVLAWRTQRMPVAHVRAFLLGIVLVPALLGAGLWRSSNRALADQPARHTFDWRGTGEMTWRSLLGLKPSDARIFAAPGYWDQVTENGRAVQPLLAANGYSYPALLHLGIFTDVMDFALNGSLDNGAPRPEPQRSASPWAVRIGVGFSVAGLLALVAFTLQLGRALIRPATLPAATRLTLGLLGFAWFAPLVLTLPFVHHAYDWGYWLPRLVLPALWAFAAEMFFLLGAWTQTKPNVRNAVIAGAALQTGLHLLVIWH